jgi:hypothetical protein
MSSAVTDGQHVWVMTGTGMLSAFDFVGNETWTRDVQKDYGRFGIMHASAGAEGRQFLIVDLPHRGLVNGIRYGLRHSSTSPPPT